jgi:S-adenosylmethionine:tRNA ribosyltransferase-isomerase
VLVTDFDFDLPDALIAQEPPAERGASRLMVVTTSGGLEHRMFHELPDYLRAGDLLVLNDTRVFPARLVGRRLPGGGVVECLLLGRVESSEVGAEVWSALLRPSQKLSTGQMLVFERGGSTIHAEVVAKDAVPHPRVRLTVAGGTVADAIEQVGHIPLPPYIRRPDTMDDRARYQTVFARRTGSIAAPTAGLHFTPGILDAVRAAGVEVATLTLHVGYGTFKPVKVDHVEAHQVDPESYDVSIAAAEALTRARREGRRILAVGTTTTRVLETLAVGTDGRVTPATGETRTFIYPGHHFRLVDGLITNFHLPRSSLLMLVAAFAGREVVLGAYREAVARGYRFYSYGDAMFILR